MRIVPDEDDSDREVMTSLPRSRPVRRSTKRAERPAAGGAKEPATTADANGASAERSPRSTPRPKPASAASSAGPRSTPRPKPASAASPAGPRSTPRPKPASATATPRPEPEPDAAAEAPHGTPRRKIPAAGYAAPSERPDEGDSALSDLLSTTVQAAGELAQIGIDVGRAAVRSMLDRLPKP